MFKNAFVKFVIVFAITMLSVAVQGSALTLIENGDFSDGLNGWMVFADPEPFIPFPRDGMAVFPENTWADWDPRSALIQTFQFDAPNMYRIELDLSMHILSSETFGGVLNNSLLFEFNQSGPLFVNGTLETSSLGSDWYHYKGDFFLDKNYPGLNDGSLFFWLEDYDGVINGSEAWLDNVSINSVPEPCTAILLGLGFLTLTVSRRHNRKIRP